MGAMARNSKSASNFEMIFKNSLSKKLYPVGDREYNLRELLNDRELMERFVESSPDEAFALYMRARDWNHYWEKPSKEIELFLRADVIVENAFVRFYLKDKNHREEAIDIQDSMAQKKREGA